MNNCCYFNISYKYSMRIKYIFYYEVYNKFLKLIIPIFSHTMHKFIKV